MLGIIVNELWTDEKMCKCVLLHRLV
jgi:hypothetical protein